MRRVVFAVIGLGLVAIVALGLTQTKSDTAAPRSAAPAGAARALAGSPPALAALHDQANAFLSGSPAEVKDRLTELRGHPVVVNGWASWCGPCRAEFPFLQRASVRFGRQVAFLGLNAGDNAADAKKFNRAFPVSYPSYVDPSFRTTTALKSPKGLPFTLFYDKAGKLAFVHQGAFQRQSQLDAAIRRYARL